MRIPGQSFNRCQLVAAIFYCGWLSVSSVQAGTTVYFNQTARDDSTSAPLPAIDADAWLETGQRIHSLTAPAADNGYRFTHWSNGSYPAEAYRDAWGRAENPINFVLLEDSTATAHYLPENLDNDADGVPDWFELEYYGDLDEVASSDSDGDGASLAAEYAAGSHPLYADSASAGGLFWADSPLVVANLAGYASYTIRSTPPGAVDIFEYAAPGTQVTTSDFSTDPSFGYWKLKAERQADPWGVAYSQLRFIMGTENREALAYFFTGDSDADGVEDAWEQYYFGSLEQAATDDADGDGLSLLEEFSGDTHPRYADSASEGGIFWTDSASVQVNLAGFSRYTLSSVPEYEVAVSAIVADGSQITTPSMDQADFAYWTLDGVRQEDAWGVALRTLSFVVDGADRTAVAHLIADDSDADGINDGYEHYYYGSLANSAADDSDGDGLSLLEEYNSGTHPRYADSVSDGGVFWTDSDSVIANLQPFERLQQLPIDGILTDFFSPHPNTPGAIDVGDFASVAVSDWDGDGDPDLFVAHSTGLRIWQNIGTINSPDFSEVRSGFSGLSSLIGTIDRPRIAGGDWNGDGKGDLVVGGNAGSVRLIASSGSWASDGSGVDISSGSDSALPTLGDMNDDGHDDLLLLLANGLVDVYLSDGSAAPFSAAPLNNYLSATITQQSSLSTGDIDGDGHVDVLVADTEGRIWEFLQKTDGSFLLQSKVWGGSYNGFAANLGIAALDLEGDGDLDLIAGGNHGGLIGLRDPNVGRPTGLIANQGAESISLYWNPSWQSRIRGYSLYRRNDAAGAFDRRSEDIIPLPAYLDTDVSAGLEYGYYATAISQFYLPGNSEPRIEESLPSDIVSVSSGSVTLTMRPAKGAPGGLASINISINNAQGIIGEDLEIEVTYDPSVLSPASKGNPELESVSTTGLSSALGYSHNAAIADGTFIITGQNGHMEPGAGKLFSLHFLIDAAASSGQATQVSISQASLYSTSGAPVQVNIGAPALVEFEASYLRGDVNRDGRVDKDDENLIKFYMKPKSPEPPTEILLTADLNGDGQITPKDLVLFKRLVNGID
jgi:hypothetical protein